MSGALDPGAIIAATEAGLVRALGLRRLNVPGELANLQGEYKGDKATLTATAYRGERVAYARFVVLRGAGLSIGNALCLSSHDLGLPILGIDVVALGRSSLVAIADLSPIHPDLAVREGHARRFAAWRSRGPRLPSAGELPAWCARWFSVHALFTRTSMEQITAVASAVEACWRSYLELDGETTPAPHLQRAVRRAQLAYASAHLREDRGLRLLQKIIQPRLAERFLRELLFPSRVPAWS
jgi:hypothetical protein